MLLTHGFDVFGKQFSPKTNRARSRLRNVVSINLASIITQFIDAIFIKFNTVDQIKNNRITGIASGFEKISAGDGTFMSNLL